MINKNGNHHLYQQIRDDIKARIERGSLKPGDKIGTEKELTEKYDVSRPTVRQALQELEKLGMVIRLLGKGTFVKENEEKTGSVNSRVIAVIVPVVSELFIGELITGAQDIIHQRGYSTKLLITASSLEKEREYLEKSCQEGVAGVVIHPTKGSYYNNGVIKVIEKGIPLVMTGRYYRYINCSYVAADNYQGTYEATRYLIDRGHTRIGLVSKKPLMQTSLRDRIEGYKDCLSDRGIVIDRGMIMDELLDLDILYSAREENIPEFRRQLEEYLRKYPEMTAVIALNDSLGTEVIFAARKVGRKVPEELSIIGFDNVSLSTRIDTQLTTINWSRKDIGERAAENLIDLIEGKVEPPVREVLPVSLVERNSVCSL